MATGGDIRRAIKLTKQAREVFEKSPKASEKELEEVGAWLKKHDTSKSQTNAENHGTADYAEDTDARRRRSELSEVNDKSQSRTKQ